MSAWNFLWIIPAGAVLGIALALGMYIGIGRLMTWGDRSGGVTRFMDRVERLAGRKVRDDQ